jgi:hypothetical protein
LATGTGKMKIWESLLEMEICTITVAILCHIQSYFLEPITEPLTIYEFDLIAVGGYLINWA